MKRFGLYKLSESVDVSPPLAPRAPRALISPGEAGVSGQRSGLVAGTLSVG